MSNQPPSPGPVAKAEAADPLHTPTDPAKQPSSWRMAIRDFFLGPIPEKARKPTLWFFIGGTMLAVVFAGVHWYQAGWKWGLLLLTIQVALLSGAAGLLFPARWASLITVISMIGTLVGFWQSPPWDTTPKTIYPKIVIDEREFTDGLVCNLDPTVKDPTKNYVCSLSVDQSHPSSTTTSQSAPAK